MVGVSDQKKIIITGASGFVGENLKSYLNEEYVINPYSLRSSNNGLKPEPAYGYIHLAGKAHDVKKTLNPQEYYQVNYELTKKLYDAFLKSSAKKFIFISSVKAAADSVPDILTEDVIAYPLTDYGKSKLMAEEYIQSQPLPAGKSYYILRPCMIHGPGNKGNLNLLYKFVKKGIPYPLAAFVNKRSFLSVENLCFVIKQFLEKDNIPPGIYNVADDESLSTNEVVTILASSLNVKPKLWRISARIIKFLAKTGDLLHLPLTTDRLDKLTESYVVSNQKIKQTLSVELPIKSIQGLQLTAASFKNT